MTDAREHEAVLYAKELSMRLPPGLIEAIAERAAGKVLERLGAEGLDVGGVRPRALYGAKAAARYLGWPLGRVQKMTASRTIPSHRTRARGRVTYLTAELDAWQEG